MIFVADASSTEIKPFIAHGQPHFANIETETFYYSSFCSCIVKIHRKEASGKLPDRGKIMKKRREQWN